MGAMDRVRRACRIAVGGLLAAVLAAGLAGCAFTEELPEVGGQSLQVAQDSAQQAGFYNLSSEGGLGMGRAQVWDRNWRVCSQTPGAGDVDPDALIVFWAVKEGEYCPRDSKGWQARPGDLMPNYVGKNLMDAENQLVLIPSVTATDATGAGREVLPSGLWKVCSSMPAAGGIIADTASFKAVLKGENCPAY
ncbi:hypothetical protein ABZY44_17935 [Streptomyces sp. NPDC006544]|uniref:hypothetical protein n=1 Tax=Streptomyces sp. NPDC006544 TaxID=3154583 RepID=UPI0033A7AE34